MDVEAELLNKALALVGQNAAALQATAVGMERLEAGQLQAAADHTEVVTVLRDACVLLARTQDTLDQVRSLLHAHPPATAVAPAPLPPREPPLHDLLRSREGRVALVLLAAALALAALALALTAGLDPRILQDLAP